MRFVATLSLVALALVPMPADAGKKQKAEELAAEQARIEAEQAAARIKPTVLVEVDFNEDGVIDVKNYYNDRSGSRVLVRKETDLNLDGRVDVMTYYSDSGDLQREVMDGDFDGLFDWTDLYEGGKRVRSEVDTDYNGSPDVFNTYVNGKVTKKERDTNSDGNVDFWETFDAEGNRVTASTDVTEAPEIDDPAGGTPNFEPPN